MCAQNGAWKHTTDLRHGDRREPLSFRPDEYDTFATGVKRDEVRFG
jgi:hypothetical protein